MCQGSIEKADQAVQDFLVAVILSSQGFQSDQGSSEFVLNMSCQESPNASCQGSRLPGGSDGDQRLSYHSLPYLHLQVESNLGFMET